MFTEADVGKRKVNGIEVECSDAEKSGIVAEWNDNELKSTKIIKLAEFKEEALARARVLVGEPEMTEEEFRILKIQATLDGVTSGNKKKIMDLYNFCTQIIINEINSETSAQVISDINVVNHIGWPK